MSTGYTKFQNQEAPLDGEPLPYVPAGQPPQYGQAMSMGATDPAMGQGQVQPMGAPNPAMGLGYGQPTATSVMVAPQSQTIVSTATVCQPQDYFGLALFVTICCCLPLGIVGLIKANDVRNRFQIGDIAGAEQASKEAKTYSFLGLGFGIGIIVVSIIVTIVLVVVGVNQAY